MPISGSAPTASSRPARSTIPPHRRTAGRFWHARPASGSGPIAPAGGTCWSWGRCRTMPRWAAPTSMPGSAIRCGRCAAIPTGRFWCGRIRSRVARPSPAFWQRSRPSMASGSSLRRAATCAPPSGTAGPWSPTRRAAPSTPCSPAFRPSRRARPTSPGRSPTTSSRPSRRPRFMFASRGSMIWPMRNGRCPRWRAARHGAISPRLCCLRRGFSPGRCRCALARRRLSRHRRRPPGIGSWHAGPPVPAQSPPGRDCR